jgi:hypothetical protein
MYLEKEIKTILLNLLKMDAELCKFSGIQTL